MRLNLSPLAMGVSPDEQLIGVDLISIYRVFCMYFCNLNARFTPIFLNITLILNLLMFCRNRK